MKLGIEVLQNQPHLLNQLKGRRVALLAHPASVDRDLNHTSDLLVSSGISLVSLFGPQHGMRGEKQDNMIESDDYLDSQLKIPVFSLYGRVRRPTKEMLETFDVLLVDLQDVGCRIYTFLTTLFYVMEECARYGKSVWVLDRPNPAGRPIEGTILNMNFASFVGAAPVPMRHGLTLGEAGSWYKKLKKLDLDFRVIEMEGYNPQSGVGQGWPWNELTWVNPSPNMSRLNCARAYAGTVLIEGTWISEGRGTTVPLEVVGTPWMGAHKTLKEMERLAPKWLEGCRLRPLFFEPTFHKFQGKLCAGIQLHCDGPYYSHEKFKPYRIVALMLKILRKEHKNEKIWREPPYEYEDKLLPIDILSGDSRLREWVEDSSASISDFEHLCAQDEKSWEKESREFYLYAT